MPSMLVNLEFGTLASSNIYLHKTQFSEYRASEYFVSFYSVQFVTQLTYQNI